ncbi:glycoside hydrolase family 95 protein [Atractiella rhizophila]|nr:glycoside hydrolase family 95 protein [Atractiella rhizophila]
MPLQLPLSAALLLLLPLTAEAARIALTPPPNPTSTSKRPDTLNALWSVGPGKDWYYQAYPIGNGYLGEMTTGSPDLDTHWLNIHSLWLGGPFRNASYSGGNPPASTADYYAQELAAARARIFANGTGQIDNLLGPGSDDYGTYITAGSLNISSPFRLDDLTSYTRALDMDRGLINVTWSDSSGNYERVSFCSYPASLCATNTISSVPINFTYTLGTPMSFVPKAKCVSEQTSKASASLWLGGEVTNDTYGVDAMSYGILASVHADDGAAVQCEDNADGAKVLVTGATECRVVWSGETNFDLSRCGKDGGYSCRGNDEAGTLPVSNVNVASVKSFDDLLAEHIQDYAALSGAFKLDIGQSSNEEDINTPTDQLTERYDYSVGNALLEWNVFNFGRHLLISSARKGKDRPHHNLPPNLQGIWLQDVSGPWGADYHLDINIQMYQWAGETTGIGEGIENMGYWMLYALKDRGTETAQVLYNASGYTAHTESNLFGYTGMKGAGSPSHPQWADMSSLPAWLLQHLHDHLDYNPSEVDFFREVTWPLMKDHAKFQMSFLVEDQYFNDSTLVINPCNSAEQTTVSFGCTENQNAIWELLHDIRKDWEPSGETDTEFLSNVESTLERLSDGVRIGSWGQFQGSYWYCFDISTGIFLTFWGRIPATKVCQPLMSSKIKLSINLS